MFFDRKNQLDFLTDFFLLWPIHKPKFIMKKSILVESLKAGFRMTRNAVRFNGGDLTELEYWKRIFQDAHAEYKASLDLFERLSDSWDAVRTQEFLRELKVVHKRYLHIYDYCQGYVEGLNWFSFQRELDAEHWSKKLANGVMVVGPSNDSEK